MSSVCVFFSRLLRDRPSHISYPRREAVFFVSAPAAVVVTARMCVGGTHVAICATFCCTCEPKFAARSSCISGNLNVFLRVIIFLSR